MRSIFGPPSFVSEAIVMALAPAGNLSVTTLESHDSQAPVDSKFTDSTCTLPFTATLTGRFADEGDKDVKIVFANGSTANRPVSVEVKEIRFGPQTDEHDYQFKLKHAREFLEEGNKVRAYVFFRGRSILFKEQGEVLLLRFANDLEEVGKVEGMPSLEGKKMFLYLAPKKAGSAKKSQQARDREAAQLEAKEAAKQQKEAQTEETAEIPANGGLLGNAKISADALKKLAESED